MDYHLRARPNASASELYADFKAVRGVTTALATDLTDADATVQSMEDASPAKWHLAHTTWFFETFLLARHAPDYAPFDARYAFLFNSYYEGAGERHARPKRGLITRPGLDEVFDYRAHVDGAMETLLEEDRGADVRDLVVLGLHHEQQHQELMLTDLLHLFAQNPLRPAFKSPAPLAVTDTSELPKGWTAFPGGVLPVGHLGDEFCFDNETPAHDALIRDFRLANRAVTNGEWSAFIADGGYETPSLWLSDGIAAVREQGWTAPLYWEQRDGTWWSMTLRGFQPLDLRAPVCHVSYFEAEAFANEGVEGVDLAAVAVEEAKERRLRAGGAFDAAKLERGDASFELLDVHRQLLRPKRGAFTDGGQLRRLEMREAERRQILPLRREGAQRIDGLGESLAEQLQRFAQDDELGVAADVLTRRAQMNDALRGGRDVFEGVHLGHHVVAKLLLVFGRVVEIDVVEVVAHLPQRVVGDAVQAELFFALGERKPKPSPQAELLGRAQQVKHFGRRVAGGERRNVSLVGVVRDGHGGL